MGTLLDDDPYSGKMAGGRKKKKRKCRGGENAWMHVGGWVGKGL